ncbi:MAG: diaminopimelate decarboxylase [Hadesarchaea archaeon]|nr:diaminopimelate decarboxylase [Hadesarchaea archaeon]
MFKPHLKTNDEGELVIGGISVVELADRFGTPLYIMDENRIRENYQKFYQAYSKRWSDVKIWYAYKANSNTSICKILWDEGCGAEVSSICELKTALKIGVPGKDIISNGNYKTRSELELGIENDILINVDNLQELELVNEIAGNKDKKARIGFRVNPNVKAPTHPHIATGLRESKFGFDVESGRALEAYKKAAKMNNIKVESIHSHIGSQILDPKPFGEQAEKMMNLVAKIRDKVGIELETVDMGGGLGVPYEPGEEDLTPDEMAEEVISTVKRVIEEKNLHEPTIVFEPGRSMVADAGIILSKVGYTKKREKTPDWIAIDAGMNALVRPALYDAYHHIVAANKMNEEPIDVFNVAGPLCESGDYLGKERELPRVGQGDLIAIFDTGAYGLAMSSQHTAHPRPGMILVNSGNAEVIRKPEDCEDLTRLDKVPEWLK